MSTPPSHAAARVTSAAAPASDAPVAESGAAQTPLAALPPLDPATVRRVARRIIPFMFVLYIAAYLDRINLSFAALQMKQALRFSDTVYGLGAGIFFVGYFLFEVPSNLILARVGARRWIARIMITWAVISSATAFVRTPLEFYSLRFLLGLAEAGFFPGMILYLGNWFPARERASAVSKFMTATAMAGVIGGPLSGAMLALDGTLGFAGWQWIFLAEGVPSLLLGIATLRWLTDRPEDAHWLARGEREALAARIREEQSLVAGQRSLSLGSALAHRTVWALGLLYFTLLIGMYSISLWLPQIIKGFSGLDNLQVSIVSAVPYLLASMAMVVVGRRSDRTGERCGHVAVSALVGAIGMTGSALLHAPVVAMLAVTVAAMGIWSALGPFWPLPSAFLSGTAAAGGIALINSLGNLGGFVGPFLIGRVRDLTGSFTASLLVIAAFLAAAALLAWMLRRSPAAMGVAATTAAAAPAAAGR